jgi:cell division septation protein DedD
MAEITEIAPRSAEASADAVTARAGDAGVEVMAASANAEEEEVLVVEDVSERAAVASVAEEGAGGYAVGVSLHRVPASALVLVSASLFCAIMLAGWHGIGERGEASVVAGEKQHAIIADEALWRQSGPESKSQSEPEFEPEAAQTAADAHPEADASPEPPAATEITVAEVEEAVSEDAKPVAPAPAVAASHAADGGKFTLQVGSYNLAPEADDRAASLRAAGFDARVSSVVLPGKGTWYRVQSGRFGARDEALRYEKQLKASGAVAEAFVAEIRN